MAIRIDESREMDGASRRTFRKLSEAQDLFATQYSMSRRNLIDNGAMQIAQRSTSVTGITTGGRWTADRWTANLNTMGTWTMSVEVDAPAGEGFTNSLKMLVTTADAAPAVGDFATVMQAIEGMNLQHIMKGQASALPLTVTFWVKSNLTGTYNLEINDDINGRHIVSPYTINVASTWEKKTITFEPDLSGTMTNVTTSGLRLQWWLGSGTTYTSGTLQRTWATSSSGNRNVGGPNLVATNANFWQITGVQLEVGEVATPFEVRSYGEELQRCLRYFERISPSLVFSMYGIGAVYSATNASCLIHLLVRKRASPTVTLSAANLFALATAAAAVVACTVVAGGNHSLQTIEVVATVAAGLVAGNATRLFSNNNLTSFIDVSADI